MSLLQSQSRRSTKLFKGNEIDAEYQTAIRQIVQKQEDLKQQLARSIYVKYLLIVLVTLTSSLQVALNFRLTNNYYTDVSHLILAGMNGIDGIDLDNNDNQYGINNMNDFSNYFVASLVNLATIGDGLLMVQPDEGDVTIRMEIFQVYDSVPSDDQSRHSQIYDLDTAQLENLTTDNFEDIVPIGLDITNASQVRSFISNNNMVHLSAKNVYLMFVDPEAILVCSNWSLSVEFDMNRNIDMLVRNTAEYNLIPCKDDWYGMVGYDTSDKSLTGKSVRIREIFFINYLSVAINLCTFYHIVVLIITILKHGRLEKAKLIKEKWMRMRRLQEKYQSQNQLQMAGTTEAALEQSNRLVLFTFPNTLLFVSNTFLLLANFCIISISLRLFIVFDSQMQKYAQVLLGLGCCLSWANTCTVVAIFDNFTVVTRSILLSVKDAAYMIFGVLPLFMAFLFGAYCMFHEHERFDGWDKTVGTLSAIIAGDEILDFHDALYYNYGVLGVTFSLGFCILFIISIHNMMIYIISEAFKVESELQERLSRKKKAQDTRLKRNSTLVGGMLVLPIGTSAESYKMITLAENKVEVVTKEEEIAGVKNRIFNKIIPRSRDKHLIEMQTKINIIAEDIKYLKESVQNLSTEKIDSECKQHLQLSTRLYLEFLIKRLIRLSRALYQKEEESLEEDDRRSDEA